MNNRSFLVSIAMIIMAGCVSEDDALLKPRVPISLTTSIAPTRATQDVQIGDGQEVYIWANEEEVSGTTNWDANNYIEAWHLTANATGGLTSANTYYYPTRPLSMVAIHGNFEFDEGKTQFPGVVSHTILADQSTAANLMKSDLLWWKGTGITSAGNPGGIPVTFAHNLSKIEITLSSDFYTADQLNAMEVSLCNVLPTVDLSLADGTTNAAHGTRITVTPLKPSASSPTFEAVIPAQARPDNFIVVRLDGGVVNVDAQVSEFDANTRYPYNLDITYRDVRKNPLWYVAEYNVNYIPSSGTNSGNNWENGVGTYSWATTSNEGYYFDIEAAKTAASKFSGWHLPIVSEWYSIVPNEASLWNIDDGTGTYALSPVVETFGYNKSTMYGFKEYSFWKKVSTNELHALRFLGTDYCSAWKYVWNGDENELYIYSTLVTVPENTEAAARQWYDNKWSTIYWGNNDSYGAVFRCFSARGLTSVTSSGVDVTISDPGIGYFHSATLSDVKHNGTNYTLGYRLALNGDVLYINGNGTYSNGRSVRLFRDNDLRPILPMDYIARFNMKGTATGIENQSFAPNNRPYNSSYYNAATATNFFSTFSAYEISSTGKGFNTWHLPNVDELIGILPPYYTTSGEGGAPIDVDGADGTRAMFQTSISNYTGRGERMAWGKKSTGYLVSQKFYNEYYSAGGASNRLCYAIRYKDSDGGMGKGYGIYTTAFRYEFRADYPSSGYAALIIRWRWLGADSEIKITDINKESYWSIWDGEVVLPIAGYYTNNIAFKEASSANWNAASQKNEYGYWWSSTTHNATMRHMGLACTSHINGSSYTYSTYALSVRLFADAE